MKRLVLLFLVLASLCLGAAGVHAQRYPLLDKVAQKVIQKYQSSSCEQLAAGRSQPPTGRKAEMTQKVVRLMRQDPQMRQAFINQVAAPIANKLFECGLIP
jgi:hypothetical protein